MEEDRMPIQDLHSRTGRDETKRKTQERMERKSRKRSSSVGSEKMERVGKKKEKMERYCSTGQSPQQAVAPMEEGEGAEGEEEDEEEEKGEGGGGGENKEEEKEKKEEEEEEEKEKTLSLETSGDAHNDKYSLFFYMTVVPKRSFLYTFCTLFTIILTN
jgi:hypothetical protein